MKVASIHNAVAQSTAARWKKTETMMTKWNGPATPKLLEDKSQAVQTKLEFDGKHPRDALLYGVRANESPEGTHWWVLLEFTDKDVGERPLEAAIHHQEKLLGLFKRIRDAWVLGKEDVKCECGFLAICNPRAMGTVCKKSQNPESSSK